MNLKTERQLRDENAQVWAMLEAERAYFKWQPIETAPKEGDVLVFCDDTKEMMVAFWNKRHEGWQFALDARSGPHLARPAMWMPLPAPPAGA